MPVWEYYHKSVYQPIHTRENWEHPGNFQNKSGSSAFNWVLPFYFLKRNCYFSTCKQKFLESRSQFSFKFCISHDSQFLMSFLKAQLSFPSNVVSVNITPLYFFFAQTRSPLKCKFLRFLSAQTKLGQIPYVNFELISQFLFKFSIMS